MSAGCILVVDDEVSVARALQRMVRSMGIVCELSLSCDDMIKRLSELRPTFVLLDIHMPEKSGIEALTEMRSRGFDVPTVMMTAGEREGTRNACLAAGAVEMLSKPVDAKTICTLFDRLGGRHIK